MHSRAQRVALDWPKLRRLTSFADASESSIRLRHCSPSPAAATITPSADVKCSSDNFPSTVPKDFKAGKPKSLSLDENSPLRVVDPPPRGLAGMALKVLGFYSRQSRIIRGTRTLYFRISSHADRPDLYASFGLEQSFRTTHAMLLLHMWLTLGRLRAEGRDGATVGQALYELFNHDLEKRIVGAGVKMLISKWMKELEKNFYGAVAAYDAAMRPGAGKDDLALALWRNVCAEEEDPLTPGTGTGATTGAAPEATAQARALAKYVRREATCLALTDGESLLSGNIDFSCSFPSLLTGEEKLSNPVERVPEGKPIAA